MNGNDTKNPAVWGLAFALVLCFSLLAVATHRNNIAIAESTRALCALHSNDVASLAATKRILRANPTGPIEFGGVKFSHKELVADEAKLESHIRSYSGLRCAS